MPSQSHRRPEDERRMPIDGIHEEFADSLSSGQSPEITIYLARVAEQDRAALFRRLLESEVSHRREQGESPSIAEYQPHFPQYVSEITGCFQAETIDVSPAAGELTTSLGSMPPSATAVPEVGQQFGDYELLEEIARGGMGVVYRARQRKANRIVALKMILSGAFATEEAVTRFYTEAQAAANLDHTAIIPIYDVGEVNGLHYYSMAFVSGESLAEKVRNTPLDVREAGKLMLAVSEAIAYAHQRGVIHRDLKPANILLDESGQPKITDFGLAKMEEADSQFTATGQVMGTPSYMPPDQARGNSDLIGPLADVYSLGATLYCLLTTRPPFQASSIVDTLKQVLEREPIAPRELNPSIDRDLNTICLKCLEKTPERRYSSAEALADDLRHWHRGEPISARPVGRIERGWRWCFRNPLTTSLIAISILLLITGTVVSTLFALQAQDRATDARLAREKAEASLVETRETIGSYVQTVRNAEVLHEERFRPLIGELLKDALRQYRKFIEQHRDDPTQRPALAKTYFDLAAAIADLGQEREAIDAFGEAAQLYKQLLKTDRGNLDYTRQLIATEIGQGETLTRTGDFPTALEAFRQAENVVKSYSGSQGKQSLQEDLGRIRALTARAHMRAGDAEKSLQAGEAAMATWQALVEQYPQRTEYQFALGEVQFWIATATRGTQGLAAALTAYSQAEATFRELVAAAPEQIEYQSELANCIDDIGVVYSQTGDHERSLKQFKESQALHEKLMKDHPNDPKLRNSYARSVRNVAAAEFTLGNKQRGVELAQQSLAIWQDLEKEHPDVPRYSASVVDAYRAAATMADLSLDATTSNNPETVQTALKLSLGCLRRLRELHGPESEAATIMEQRLQRALYYARNKTVGDGHPDVIAAAHVLAQPKLDELQRQLNESPQDESLHMRLAMQWTRIGFIDKATAACVAAIEAGLPAEPAPDATLPKEDEAAMQALLMILASEQRGDDASRGKWRKLANSFFSLQRGPPSREYILLFLAVFNSEIERNPHNSKLISMRARIHGMLQQLDQTASDIERYAAASRNPEQARAELIGQVMRDFGDLDRSIEFYSTLIEDAPERTSWRLARGDLLARRNRWQEALSDYAVGCLSPQNETTRWRFVALQLAAGLRDSYQTSCQNLVDESLASDSPWRPTEVARLVLLGGAEISTEQVAAILDRTPSNEKSTALHLLVRAMLEYRAGDYTAAAKEVPELTDNGHFGISARFIRAMALAKLDRHAEATALWDEADRSLTFISSDAHPWWDWLMCQQLRRESQGVLERGQTEPQS